MNRPPTVSLAEATVLLTDGTHYTPPDIGVGIPFLTVKDVSDRGLDFINSAKISAEEFARAKAQKCAPEVGDVLFSKDGTVGKVHLVTETQQFGVLSSLAILRPGKNLDSSYLAHFLRTPAAIDAAERRKTGSAIRRIVLRDLAALSVPLPPLHEQRQIATILDMADALRQKRKRAISLLDRLTQSIFLEMFGDPATGEGRWATFPIDQICTLVRGSSPRPQGDPKFFGGPVPRLMIADITRDGFWVTPRIDSLTLEGAKKSRPAPVGTVVMAVSGDVGLVSRLAVDACIHDGFVGFLNLDQSRFHPVFFMTVLHLMKALHAKGTAGAIFQNTTTSEIKKMVVPCPPMQLQAEFLSRTDLVNAARIKQKLASSEIDALFSTLQNRAFSGQL